MASYTIKKISNGEYKEVEKKLKLNVPKFVGHRDTLYFDVEGEKDPVLFDINIFANIMVEQIQKGLMESLEYNDGVIVTTVRDGNVLKKYTYDFSWGDFSSSLNQSGLDELKRTIYKIVSIYNEDPNKSITTTQRYIRMIFDIIDGVRLPKINNEEELLRIFEVYNANKVEILITILQNVVFNDDNGNVLEYGPRLRASKLKAIKYDVLEQVERAMLMFAAYNNAMELYQNYLSGTYIPRREIVYKYVDEEGNELEVVPEVEGGSIFSLGKELVVNGAKGLKNLAVAGAGKVVSGAGQVLEKVRDRKRTRK